MLLKTKEQIQAARGNLGSATFIAAADLISSHIAKDPNNWPEDRDEYVGLVTQALLAAKSQRLGRELTEEEVAKLLQSAVPHFESILCVGLSGGAWQLEMQGKIKTGLKWAGKAALIGIGAAFGLSIG